MSICLSACVSNSLLVCLSVCLLAYPPRTPNGVLSARPGHQCGSSGTLAQFPHAPSLDRAARGRPDGSFMPRRHPAAWGVMGCIGTCQLRAPSAPDGQPGAPHNRSSNQDLGSLKDTKRRLRGVGTVPTTTTTPKPLRRSSYSSSYYFYYYYYYYY